VEVAVEVLFAVFGSAVELLTVAVLVVNEAELNVCAVTFTVMTT